MFSAYIYIGRKIDFDMSEFPIAQCYRITAHTHIKIQHRLFWELGYLPAYIVQTIQNTYIF